ncbi:hypothetical protein PHYBLDRAFT_169770 [Phycomyces blakesleeanus NRRL 1555(-)]|uniref:Uncharacterized protein n=1 Tax=Phycomyces blakesleeanus (strain ATCC 8743b / DSM 1359 / FGSC 10004 / NBRC 33097 / NRRL 1555) TaxID=763407 RepID=A0A162U2N9_PHYB8|nr:hypothetical protein PHYBLDRAFT_169770 [Phycomyces blakesleeanus NRRL 1555(-)]OAD71853.1 hypothetical protein PHYBLDRAFT_169770 [Phycomyces blakesleeanus NRRL 1555(-)]|eukprot:XP_018289893.1 hypothetical protein PHYBLDRAFT_169770 [Phycomyces blakesleeanus NRRL 1555(-)]
MSALLRERNKLTSITFLQVTPSSANQMSNLQNKKAKRERFIPRYLGKLFYTFAVNVNAREYPLPYRRVGVPRSKHKIVSSSYVYLPGNTLFRIVELGCPNAYVLLIFGPFLAVSLKQSLNEVSFCNLIQLFGCPSAKHLMQFILPARFALNFVTNDNSSFLFSLVNNNGSRIYKKIELWRYIVWLKVLELLKQTFVCGANGINMVSQA